MYPYRFEPKGQLRTEGGASGQAATRIFGYATVNKKKNGTNGFFDLPPATYAIRMVFNTMIIIKILFLLPLANKIYD